ncbi:hypothetical protein VTK73DRAFT_8285 [Phialemonium thermophilum]|uniref:Uncharacterized protein n=1 Tax=Phialemonium thermophilum TaxID=223376 RepID=A0ABR3W933_9PEZI
MPRGVVQYFDERAKDRDSEQKRGPERGEAHNNKDESSKSRELPELYLATTAIQSVKFFFLGSSSVVRCSQNLSHCHSPERETHLDIGRPRKTGTSGGQQPTKLPVA